MPISQKLSESATLPRVSASAVMNAIDSKKCTEGPSKVSGDEESKLGARILQSAVEGGEMLGLVDLPMSMPYVSHRKNHGIRNLIAATVSVLVGGFLIHHSFEVLGWLRFDMMVLGVAGLGAALFFGFRSWCELLGGIEVRKEGIAVTPFWAGFVVNWSDLESWKVNKTGIRGESGYQLLLWTRGNSCPLVCPIEWISSENQTYLLSLIEKKLPHRSDFL